MTLELLISVLRTALTSDIQAVALGEVEVAGDTVEGADELVVAYYIMCCLT